MNDPKNPALEGVKEAFRIFFLGVVAYLLTEGVLNTLITVAVGTRLDPVQVTVIVSLLTALLRSVDKWLHERSKVNPDVKLKALSPV